MSICLKIGSVASSQFWFSALGSFSQPGEIAVGEREVLKTRVRLQDGKMCVQARKVEVSVFSPTANGVPLGLRLHMHLSRFKPMQPGQRHQSSLPGLFEFSEDPEECSYSSLTDLNSADDHDNPASEDC